MSDYSLLEKIKLFIANINVSILSTTIVEIVIIFFICVSIGVLIDDFLIRNSLTNFLTLLI